MSGVHGPGVKKSAAKIWWHKQGEKPKLTKRAGKKKKRGTEKRSRGGE